MKIKNKYLRNSAFRAKHWNRIRSESHPYETFCPYSYFGISDGFSYEEQVKSNFETITKKVRALESGTGKQWITFNASSNFRRSINKQRKARDRNVMNKIHNGNWDAEFDKYHDDATWHYF